MYTLGIDIGSTTSKCVLLKAGKTIIASSIVSAGIGTDGAERAVNHVLEQARVPRILIAKTAVTGYGRNIYKAADYAVSELTCHGLGGCFTYPAIRTLIDIGGQDAKVISLNANGQMENFLMNDKCAAGTGRFLEVMAVILQVPVEELADLALKADYAVPISSTCTVFAESEVISQLSKGEFRKDIAAGICESVAIRVSSFAKRVGINEPVCISGGVSKNKGVVRALERILNTSILCSENAQLFGALGAALYAWKKVNKAEKETENDG